MRFGQLFTPRFHGGGAYRRPVFVVAGHARVGRAITRPLSTTRSAIAASGNAKENAALELGDETRPKRLAPKTAAAASIRERDRLESASDFIQTGESCNPPHVNHQARFSSDKVSLVTQDRNMVCEKLPKSGVRLGKIVEYEKPLRSRTAFGEPSLFCLTAKEDEAMAGDYLWTTKIATSISCN